MANYPNSIYGPRAKENRSGVVYDATKKSVIFVEDVSKLDDEVVAIETELGANPKGAKADVKTRLDDVDQAIAGIPAVPVKATGAEINTGSDDTKYTTPKAIADSNVFRSEKLGQINALPEHGALVFGDYFLIDAYDAEWPNTTWPKKKVDWYLILAELEMINDARYVRPTQVVTLTNKRITLRCQYYATHATPTPVGDNYDAVYITAQAGNAAFGAPTGTPTNFQRLIIRIKDNGTARLLTWNAIYRAGTDIALPTTTVLGKTIYLEFFYNTADSKWDLVRKVNNI